MLCSQALHKLEKKGGKKEKKCSLSSKLACEILLFMRYFCSIQKKLFVSLATVKSGLCILLQLIEIPGSFNNIVIISHSEVGNKKTTCQCLCTWLMLTPLLTFPSVGTYALSNVSHSYKAVLLEMANVIHIHFFKLCYFNFWKATVNTVRTIHKQE